MLWPLARGRRGKGGKGGSASLVSSSVERSGVQRFAGDARRVVVDKKLPAKHTSHRCTLSVPALITTDLQLWLHNLHAKESSPTSRPHTHAAFFSWQVFWRLTRTGVKSIQTRSATNAATSAIKFVNPIIERKRSHMAH
jgi:hypothetical protein